MPVVQETLVLPGGDPAAFAVVTVQLYDPNGAGFYPPDLTIISTEKVRADADGFWTMTLTPNSEILPEGTVWRRTVTAARSTIRVVADDFLLVPVGGGPYEVQELLVDPPDALPSSALAVHAALQGPGAHLPSGGDEGDVPILGPGDVVVWGPQSGGISSVSSADGSIDVDVTDPENPVISTDAAIIPAAPAGLSATEINAALEELAALNAITLAAVNDIPETRGGLVVTGGFVDVAAVDVQEFTAAGADTWTKPDNLLPTSIVRVYLQQGGGGGGSGRKGAEGSDRGGGVGGMAGAVKEFEVLASSLGDTVAVTVGAGGTAGAAVAANSTEGNPGGSGGASSFGAISVTSTNGGGPGSTSVAIPTPAPGCITGSPHLLPPTDRPLGTGSYGSSFLGLTSLPGGNGHSGGGAGGGFRTAANADPGISAGTGGSGTAGGGGTAGTAAVPAGGAGTTSPNGLAGGGGGGGGFRSASGVGGAGGWPGGGGGGGGAGINSAANSGAGGVGGHGYVRVVTIR